MWDRFFARQEQGCNSSSPCLRDGGTHCVGHGSVGRPHHPRRASKAVAAQRRTAAHHNYRNVPCRHSTGSAAQRSIHSVFSASCRQDMCSGPPGQNMTARPCARSYTAHTQSPRTEKQAAATQPLTHPAGSWPGPRTTPAYAAWRPTPAARAPAAAAAPRWPRHPAPSCRRRKKPPQKDTGRQAQRFRDAIRRFQGSA